MILKISEDEIICPKCKRATLDARTKRGFLVKTTLFWLPIKRYKCYSCSRKTYVYDRLGSTHAAVSQSISDFTNR